MVDHPGRTSDKHQTPTDGKMDVQSHGDNQARQASSKMYEDVGAAMAGGAAAGAIGEGLSKLAKHASAKSEQKDGNPAEQAKELAKEKAGPLPNFEVTHHALDGKTQHSVDAAAKQISDSDGKNHKLADAVMKHAYLTDGKGLKGDHYNEVYKALSDGVAKLHHGGDGVISKVTDFGHGRVSAQVMEHGRLTPSVHESSNNYYKSAAKTGASTITDARH